MNVKRAGAQRLRRFVAGVLVGLALDLLLFAAFDEDDGARSALLAASVMAVVATLVVQSGAPGWRLRPVRAACGAACR